MAHANTPPLRDLALEHLLACNVALPDAHHMLPLLTSIAARSTAAAAALAAAAAGAAPAASTAAQFASVPPAYASEPAATAAVVAWQLVTQEVLNPDLPFALHELLYHSGFAEWDEATLGPPPVWCPAPGSASETNLGSFLRNHGPSILRESEGLRLGSGSDPSASYRELHRVAYNQPHAYWPVVLRELDIIFSVTPTCIARFDDAATTLAQVAAARNATTTSSISVPVGPRVTEAAGAAPPPPGAAAVAAAGAGGEGAAAGWVDVRPGGRWLPGAMLNVAESCLEPTWASALTGSWAGGGKRRDDRAAVVWREEGEDEDEEGREGEEGGSGVAGRRVTRQPPIHSLTLAELRLSAKSVAVALVELGFGEGSVVAIDLPMTVASVAVYLGIVLAGAAVVSIADSFAPPEIASRLRVSNARLIFTQDVVMRGSKALPLYRKVVDAGAPRAIVLLSSAQQAVAAGPDAAVSLELRPGDLLFEDFVGLGRTEGFVAAQRSIDATVNILFSSGTTGTPKAIPWTQATPIKAAADGMLHQDIKAGDVVAWPTSMGWMMGPWLLFATLVNGATLALFHGSPLGRPFLRFVRDTRVSVLGVVPSMVRAWNKLHSSSSAPCFPDWSSVRVFSSTGEASTPSDSLWLMSRACYRAPIIEYCGGTELGGAFATGTLVQPQALSCFSTATLGCQVVLLDEQQHLMKRLGQTGECALMPRILGASWKLLNSDHFRVYFEGMPCLDDQILRRHGDAFEMTAGGFLRAHGRVDDTMNLGGVKVSSVEIERVCNTAHPSVLETAAIGVPPAQGGPEELVLFVVLREHDQADGAGIHNGTGGGVRAGGATAGADAAALKASFLTAIQRSLNPLFKVAAVHIVPSLPRTATNKVLRRQLRQLYVASRGKPLQQQEQQQQQQPRPRL